MPSGDWTNETPQPWGGGGGTPGDLLLIIGYPKAGLSITDTTGIAWALAGSTSQVEVWYGFVTAGSLAAIGGTLEVSGSWCWDMVSLGGGIDPASPVAGIGSFSYSLSGLGSTTVSPAGTVLLPRTAVSLTTAVQAVGSYGTAPNLTTHFADIQFDLGLGPILGGVGAINWIPGDPVPSPPVEYTVRAVEFAHQAGCVAATPRNVIAVGSGPTQGIPGAEPPQSASGTLLVVYFNELAGTSCGGGGGGTGTDDDGPPNGASCVSHDRLPAGRILLAASHWDVAGHPGPLTVDRYGIVFPEHPVATTTVETTGVRSCAIQCLASGWAPLAYVHVGVVTLRISRDGGESFGAPMTISATGYRHVTQHFDTRTNLWVIMAWHIASASWHLFAGFVDVSGAPSFPNPLVIVAPGDNAGASIGRDPDGIWRFALSQGGSPVILRTRNLRPDGTAPGGWVP